MTRFRCLAGDCEATCCGGWGIAVEPTAHRRLQLLSESDPAMADLVERSVELTPAGPDYARLRLLPSGGCSMLDEQGLCSIHAKLGHEALFEVCATYPRYASQIDDELELMGTLSCPEVARLALLADDAFELTPTELDEVPRKLRNRFDTRRRPYYRPFKLVRSAMLGLMSRPGYRLSEKLFVLLWLSDKLRPILYSGCDAISEAELRSLFGALSDAPVLDSLASGYRGLVVDGALPLLIIHSALRPGGASTGAQTARFEAIVHEVWAQCGLPLGDGSVPKEAELPAVWQRYVTLRTEVPEAVMQRIELCLSRYAQNHLLTSPYMLAENLFEYTYDLTVRVAALRFLLSVRSAAFSGSPKALDAQIVEVVFAFARAVEHADLPRRLQSMLAAQGLGGLAHAVCFLAV